MIQYSSSSGVMPTSTKVLLLLIFWVLVGLSLFSKVAGGDLGIGPKNRVNSPANSTSSMSSTFSNRIKAARRDTICPSGHISKISNCALQIKNQVAN